MNLKNNILKREYNFSLGKPIVYVEFFSKLYKETISFDF